MYYVLDYDTFSEGEALELPRPELPDDDVAFDDGVRVADPPERITFAMTADERGELGDQVLTGLPGLVVSAKFRQALEAAGVDNVQYVPAEIRDEVTGQVHGDYFVANVVGVADCIDMEKSKLTMRAAFPDKIRSIEELHIDESRVDGMKMFRLARRTTLVLLDESVKEALEAAELRGVALVPTDEFST